MRYPSLVLVTAALFQSAPPALTAFEVASVRVSANPGRRSVTITEFVEGFLSGLPVFDRPVLNRTALEGRFTFTLNVLDDPSIADVKSQVAAGGPDLLVRALEAIGLTLMIEKLDIETLVVDRA